MKVRISIYKVFWILFSITCSTTSTLSQTAKQILDATGVKGGLIVHLGCGEGILHDKNWGRDKGMGLSRQRPPVWSDWVPIRIRAMTLAGEHLFVAGPPDVLDENDPMASFEGHMGGLVRVYNGNAGKHTRQYKLTTPPVFDGMIAADGNLLIATTDGRVICMGGSL